MASKELCLHTFLYPSASTETTSIFAFKDNILSHLHMPPPHHPQDEPLGSLIAEQIFFCHYREKGLLKHFTISPKTSSNHPIALEGA